MSIISLYFVHKMCICTFYLHKFVHLTLKHLTFSGFCCMLFSQIFFMHFLLLVYNAQFLSDEGGIMTK